MKPLSIPSNAKSLKLYFAEINRFPLLSAEEEKRLARVYCETGDTRAAHTLVSANLRFVVKVAYEYRWYGFPMADLIQEGNIGLMKAVQKFDPDKNIRLISYAVWWIRAYIQNDILRSWSLVKLGTTQAQRKLFFSLSRTKRELDKMSALHGMELEQGAARIAERLSVKPGEVQEMEHRLEGRDMSLDAPLGDDGGSARVDMVAGQCMPQDDELSGFQEQRMMHDDIGEALAKLDQRERYIIEKRAMSDKPMTLKQLGKHFGFSRERARQLEIRAKDKLHQTLRSLAIEIAWPTNGAPVEIDDGACV